MKDWKVVFRKDVNEKLKISYKEFQLYKDTDNLIYLQQAGNKLFSVVENYLMLKHNQRVKSYQKLLFLVDNNSKDVEILVQAVQLHYFFYNADLQMDRYTAEKLYKIVYNKMIRRLKK